MRSWFKFSTSHQSNCVEVAATPSAALGPATRGIAPRGKLWRSVACNGVPSWPLSAAMSSASTSTAAHEGSEHAAGAGGHLPLCGAGSSPRPQSLTGRRTSDMMRCATRGLKRLSAHWALQEAMDTRADAPTSPRAREVRRSCCVRQVIRIRAHQRDGTSRRLLFATAVEPWSLHAWEGTMRIVVWDMSRPETPLLPPSSWPSPGRGSCQDLPIYPGGT